MTASGLRRTARPGSLVVEGHVVAHDVLRPEGHFGDDVPAEGLVDRTTEIDRGVHSARKPGHGAEIAPEGHPEVRDLAVAEPAGFRHQPEHDLVAFDVQRDGILPGARLIEREDREAHALSHGQAHVVAIHLVGVDAAAEDEHGLAAEIAGRGEQVHRQVDGGAAIGEREHPALELDGKAGRRGHVRRDLILRRPAARVVGEAGELGVAVSEGGEERVSRLPAIPAPPRTIRT